MASPTLKRSSASPLPTSSTKRQKPIPKIDTSGRSLYYLATSSSLQLGLPAISLTSLLSLTCETEVSSAETAWIVTGGREEKVVEGLRSGCKGQVRVSQVAGKGMRGGLWLVRFADRLRVVVTSARLQSWDLARLLHTVWFQDFPVGYSPCAFAFTLTHYVNSLIPSSVLQNQLGINLGQYDFSDSAVDLITTVPGVYPSHTHLGILQLADSVPRSLPFSGLLSSTTELMKDYSLLLALQAHLNLPKYTDILIGYPSYSTVAESRFGLGGGGFASPNSSTIDSALYSDLCLKSGLEVSGRSALPGYNMLVLGGDMVPEADMVIYSGCHALTAEDWGIDLGNGHWRYGNWCIGVVFKRLKPEERRSVLRSIPYALGERLDQERAPWQPRRHLLYI